MGSPEPELDSLVRGQVSCEPTENAYAVHQVLLASALDPLLADVVAAALTTACQGSSSSRRDSSCCHRS